MNHTDQTDNLLNYLCASLFDLQGRLRASEVVLSSMVSVVCENAPELIDQLKLKISDTADLSTSMGELSTEPALEAFKREIRQSMAHFSLFEEASKHCSTTLGVKSKL